MRICHVFALLSAVACGNHHLKSGNADAGSDTIDADAATVPDATNATVTGIAFDPPSAIVQIDNGVGPSASFKLIATMSDGTTQEVWANALQFDRPDLAAMQAGEPVVLAPTGTVGGHGTLHGIYMNMAATATLEVAIHASSVGPGVTAGAQSGLDGATAQDPSLTSLLYPYDKTYFPLGITSPLTMWNAPEAGDTYRIHLEESDYSYDLYTIVTAPAQVRIDQLAWDRLTASNQGDALRVTLSRWNGTNAWVSAQQSYTIVGASLRGAIYYWTTSGGGHMSRIRPGTGAQPEVLNNGKCMGCHAVSADGSTLVAALGFGESTAGSPPGPLQSEDKTDGRPWATFGLPTATMSFQSNMFAGNVAVTPDGAYTVFGDQKLYLANTASGTLYTSTGLDNFALDTNMNGLMTPAFSPDGKKFVAVEGAGTWYHDLTGGKIVAMDFDQTSRSFTNPAALVSASAFPSGERAMAYPSFAPDASYIAYHVGNYTTGCNATGCTDTATQTGSLFVSSVTTPGAPIRLATLTDTSPKAADHDLSFEPTFNPVARGGYNWMVFTSMRDWGNRITGTADNGKKRLWVSAIDPTTGASDPSHPPFFLEGQEETTTNMRGFWALAACIPTQGGGGCSAGFECCSGFCDNGSCVDVGQYSCQSIGQSCQMDSDCCNSPYVTCVSGTCQLLIQ